MKIFVAVTLSLGLGYLSFPILNPQPTQSPVVEKVVVNYDQIVESISKKVASDNPELHDQMLVHEVLFQNSIMEQEYILQMHEMVVQKDIREKTLMKSLLQNLKTPEAQAALLNVATGQTQYEQ